MKTKNSKLYIPLLFGISFLAGCTDMNETSEGQACFKNGYDQWEEAKSAERLQPSMCTMSTLGPINIRAS